MIQEERASFEVKLQNKVPLIHALDEISRRIANFSTDCCKSSKLDYQRKRKDHVCLVEKRTIKPVKINNKPNSEERCYNINKQQPNQINKTF